MLFPLLYAPPPHPLKTQDISQCLQAINTTMYGLYVHTLSSLLIKYDGRYTNVWLVWVELSILHFKEQSVFSFLFVSSFSLFSLQTAPPASTHHPHIQCGWCKQIMYLCIHTHTLSTRILYAKSYSEMYLFQVGCCFCFALPLLFLGR